MCGEVLCLNLFEYIEDFTFYIEFVARGNITTVHTGSHLAERHKSAAASREETPVPAGGSVSSARPSRQICSVRSWKYVHLNQRISSRNARGNAAAYARGKAAYPRAVTIQVADTVRSYEVNLHHVTVRRDSNHHT
jgi:hypothetical protein